MKISISRPVKPIFADLLVAISYFVAGAAIIELLPSWTQPSPIWPPAGVTLAATLMLGWRSIPGIFIGAMATNTWYGPVRISANNFGEALFCSAPFACAAVIQAVTSLVLIKPTLPHGLDLCNSRSVIKLFILGGPIACLAGATSGLTFIQLSGHLQDQRLADGLITWWIGDIIGIVTITPILIPIMANPRQLWHRRIKFLVLPLMTSLLMVSLFYYQTFQSEESIKHENLKSESDFLAGDIHNGLTSYKNAVQSLGDFYAKSYPRFKRQEFASLTKDILPRYPGILGFSWNPVVPKNEKSKFEKSMRKQGIDNFKIQELHPSGGLRAAAVRDYYVPFAYVEIKNGDPAATGFDINSSDNRKKAIDQATRSRDAVATPIVDLYQDPTASKGILLLYAIRSDGSSNRSDNLPHVDGFVVAMLRIDDLVEAIVGNRLRTQNLDLHVEANDGQTIYDSIKPDPQKYQNFMQRRSVSSIDGIEWTLRITPTDAFFEKFGEYNARIVLIAGLMFTGLIGIFILILIGRNERLSRETDEKRRTEAALAGSEARKAAALEASIDAIISIDRHGNITDFNPTAETMFQYKKNQVLGESLSEKIIPERFRKAHHDGINRYLKTRESKILGARVEVVAVRSDGSEFPIEIAPVSLEIDGEIVFTGVVRDITERKRLEENLKAAKENAEAANEAKTTFLANMSHELRTPLGAVLGFSEMLASHNITPNEREKYLDIVKRNGALLSNVINDILDLSKVEAGKIEIEVQECSVREILSDIEVLLKPQACDKNIQLEFIIQKDIPTIIYTDPLRLRQILLNIIGNGVKFTERGSVSVQVNFLPSTKQIPMIEFCINDTGPGIRPDRIATLFQPFSQADASTTRKFGGTGLGLVLARKLSTLLHGDLQLTSTEVGVGSEFRITISSDLRKSKEDASGLQETHNQIIGSSQRSIRTASKQDHRLDGKTILLVEDAPDIRLMITSILRYAGANVDSAENGLSAIDMIHHKPYDIILMDLQMPILDGYEATRRLRAEGYSLPIVALTAHALMDQKMKCKEAGFSTHISKPVQVEKLVEAIKQLA